MNQRFFGRGRNALIASAFSWGIMLSAAHAQSVASDAPTAKSRFALSSPDIANGGKISGAQVFNSFGCSGRNMSPALSWSDAPAGTKSFALLVHDPDAPTGSGWWHWVVYNIPADTTSLPADATAAFIGFNVKANSLGETEILGLYGR